MLAFLYSYVGIPIKLCWYSYRRYVGIPIDVMLAFPYSYVDIPIELCCHSYRVMLAFIYILCWYSYRHYVGIPI